MDEAALINVLQGGRINGAYLDVFENEPLSKDSLLWNMPGVIITPHDATISSGNYPRGVQLFLRNLQHYLNSDTLENEVPQ